MMSGEYAELIWLIIYTNMYQAMNEKENTVPIYISYFVHCLDYTASQGKQQPSPHYGGRQAAVLARTFEACTTGDFHHGKHET
jgi:hypothetical protein